MTTIPTLGPDASIGDILFAQPQRFGPVLALAQNVMRGDGALEPANREFLAAYVSALNSCSFCHGVHTAVAKRFGTDPDLLQATLANLGTASISDQMRAILAFAKKLVSEPSRVTDADRSAVLEAGNDKSVLDDAIAIVSLFSFFNRLVDGHGVQGNSDIFERDSEMLFAFGYEPPAQ